MGREAEGVVMTFESWVSQFWPPSEWFMDDHDIQRWRAAYEALDRAAREECAAICERRAEIQEIAGISIEAQCCADEIRDTMK
jgi:hypothetical protein